jgi:GT2 family glycosyltransferase
MAVMHRVDVVVVSSNSRDTLRDCLRGVVGHPEINVIVVDNASADGSVEGARELGVTAVAAPGNVGFGAGLVLWALVRIVGGSGDRVARTDYLQALGRVLQALPWMTP